MLKTLSWPALLILKIYIWLSQAIGEMFPSLAMIFPFRRKAVLTKRPKHKVRLVTRPIIRRRGGKLHVEIRFPARKQAVHEIRVSIGLQDGNEFRQLARHIAQRNVPPGIHKMSVVIGIPPDVSAGFYDLQVLSFPLDARDSPSSMHDILVLRKQLMVVSVISPESTATR